MLVFIVLTYNIDITVYHHIKIIEVHQLILELNLCQKQCHEMFEKILIHLHCNDNTLLPSNNKNCSN